MRYTYSRWTGSELGAVDADDLMAALSDDLMADGNIDSALQRITRWGLQIRGENRAQGVQGLMQQLRDKRERELERYHLDSMMEGIKERLDAIVQAERDGLASRLDDARSRDDSHWREAMEEVARRKLNHLDSLPDEPGAAVDALADYEFIEDRARHQFDQLLSELRQHVLESHFDSIRDSLGNLSDADIEDLKSMTRDLNAALRQHLDGGEPDFDHFMETHGRYFPETSSFDDVVERLQQQAARTESLMRSMSPRMRRELEDTLRSLLWDEELQHELASMAEILQSISAFRRPVPGYAFSGEESITLEESLSLMRRLHDMDQLEKDMKRAQDTGSLDHIDAERVRYLLGDDAYAAMDQLKRLSDVLEEAGYVESREGTLELTARGIRVIGQKALQEIFQHLGDDSFGNHPTARRGLGGDRVDETKRYEYGDSFLLDLTRTLMNAVHRSGSGSPLQLEVSDFEVSRTEQLAQSATVLMLDMSRSMPLRGCFVAAKKVALALNSLIQLQFPRDHLYIIGFSDYARELRPESLHQISWGDHVYGTNMQHGFIVARRLLGRHKSGNRQVILITDGEPTAHFEGDRVHFAYPPTFRTFQETLREVKRCTQEGIRINTFMLERSHYLAEFVRQMTKINRGRAFFATPERLGDYVLVDYVANKRVSR
jgi:uncharacterized protein with von Willebrand factor type A (vWA) domain